MLGIARIYHSNSCTPSPGFCYTVDTRDMYALLNIFFFSLPVLVVGKTLLPESSVQCATPSDPSTVTFISASTPPLPQRHGPNFKPELRGPCQLRSTNAPPPWEWKTTFTHESTPGMLSYNDDFHSGHVDYHGTIGKWYKAYVCIWGGKDGDGDTRYFWTSGQKATLLPD